MFEDPKSKYELSELLVPNSITIGKNWAWCSVGSYYRKASTGPEKENNAWFQSYQQLSEKSLYFLQSFRSRAVFASLIVGKTLKRRCFTVRSKQVIWCSNKVKLGTAFSSSRRVICKYSSTINQRKSWNLKMVLQKLFRFWWVGFIVQYSTHFINSRHIKLKPLGDWQTDLSWGCWINHHKRIRIK